MSNSNEYSKEIQIKLLEIEQSVRTAQDLKGNGRLYEALELYKECIQNYLDTIKKIKIQQHSSNQLMLKVKFLMKESEELKKRIKLRYAVANMETAMDIEEKLIKLKKDPSLDLNILKNSVIHCIDCYNKAGDDFIINDEKGTGQNLKQHAKTIAMENQHIDIIKKDDLDVETNNALKRNLSESSKSIIDEMDNTNDERSPLLILSAMKFAFDEKIITLEEKCILKDELISGREFTKDIINKLLPGPRSAFISYENTHKLKLLNINDQNSISLSNCEIICPRIENFDTLCFERDLLKKLLNKYELEAHKVIELIPSCPISAEKFVDPLVCSFCGNSFERQYITDWLSKNSSCPTCRNVVALCNYLPNLQLRNFIESLNKK